ncbi:MAG: alpha/beta hydrolase [Gammaproteobacteria bacterium]
MLVRVIFVYWGLIASLLLSGCTPVMKGPGPTAGQARLTETTFVAADGAELPLSRWSAENPKAVLVALHGFNDYRHFFEAAADYLSQRQILCYAYDQRGFGASPNTGYWAGEDTYAADLKQFTQLVRFHHPGLPVYLLGESMGGAIVIDAMASPQKPDVNGIILSAPAVWGRQTMPWYQTSLLWTLSHTLPWLTLTGKGLQIMPSDNIDMLRALGRDPLVIKETRVDAIYGLTNLMDEALSSANKLDTQTLLLYGEKDEVVPQEPTRLFVQDLLTNQPNGKTVAYYQNGYHMLLRDLEAPLIWQDIAHWILERNDQLPSGADRNRGKLLKQASAGDSETYLGRLASDQ